MKTLTQKKLLTDEKDIRKCAKAMTRKNWSLGIQTVISINTLMTTNGQRDPFVTLFMYVEDGLNMNEVAQIIEVRNNKTKIRRIKNEKRSLYNYTAFPKLIYVFG